MNGAQDMGGMMGFGPIVREENEPFFHAPWERKAMGLTLAAGTTGMWSLDHARAARESLPPGEYLTSPYYGIWLKALATTMVNAGLATEREVATGVIETPPVPVKRILRPEEVAGALAKGWPASRPEPHPAPFRVGDTVRTRIMNPVHHTRLPRYARGKTGVIETVHGVHVFPDSHAQGLGENPQWLFSVCFTGEELWGADAEPGTRVSVEAWESYLEPVA
ncbi:nitrile hydratase [Azorhizobium oxalatiphilum]|uniref:Nitrile hydratase subunit beta n=1 Tax=Azorhizobium oxalatiphilum TaxID=980631 RepID=A0A917BZG2_9HYPH|nr:nitrile hydratase subunit beta [Azorhizobium oxalatiphilum]GGF61492.1 nitrile hydratase [Azorhizobium oxalatiphilum]